MNAARLRRPESIPRHASGAIIFGEYRYLLWRTWGEAAPRLLWVLLNPSTADERADDPTLRRCTAFSRAWGYGGVEIANLFAFRTPHPQQLRQPSDPVGSENDRYLVAGATRAGGIVAAWGADGGYQGRDQVVLALLARHASQPLMCLGTTRNGSPRHPLYIAGSTILMPYRF
jgi:hypothetical protein